MTEGRDKARVVTVGRLYCDLIFTGIPRLPTMGTEVFTEGFGLHAGGGAAITAAHLAALGRPVSLVATLPAAPFGTLVKAELAAADVDLSLCQPATNGAAAQVTVALVGQGDRAFVTHKTGPAAPDITAADLAATGAGHLHIGELATLIEMPTLLTAAREAGLTVSLDCGWEDDLPVDAAAALIASVDVFLPNEAEAEHLAGLGLSPPFAPLTVIKRGAAGAEAMTRETRVCAPAQPATVVDATGAGDAFNAGFLDAWLDRGDIGSCLHAGNACGARAIGQRGGFG